MVLFLKSLLSNKWVIYGAIALLLLTGAYFIIQYNNTQQFDRGFSAGESSAQIKNQIQQTKARQAYDKLQADADAERLRLNNEILSLKQQRDVVQKKLDEKKNKSNEELINYGKINSSNLSCFAPNDNGMRIINDSFPSITY